MPILAFVDLDDSLFQTRAKCPEGEELIPVAYRKDGTALGFMTRRQRLFFEHLAQSATLIPTTARNLDAYRRVRLPFAAQAILNFGAVILDARGQLDRAWDEQVRSRLRACAGRLHEWHRALEQFIEAEELGAQARLISDFEMAIYVVVKHPDGDLRALERLRAEVLPTLAPGFFVHANDNNLSLVPDFLGKEHAVRHVRDRYYDTHDPLLTLGLGDSLTDAGFLDECDFRLVPRGSQLARQQPTPGGDHV